MKGTQGVDKYLQVTTISIYLVSSFRQQYNLDLSYMDWICDLQTRCRSDENFMSLL